MSSEIVAGLDGSSLSDVDGISESGSDTDGSRWIKPLGLGITEDIGAVDLKGFRADGSPSVPVDVIGENHHMTNFISPEKGHKYVTQSNPTFLPHSINEPSVLLLRGCDQLLLPSAHFPFAKFKTLTVLEISGISHLTTLPKKAISEITQLQALNLSRLPIQQLPDDFFSNLMKLRSLILRHCSNLHSLPKLPQLTDLQSLDLSHLLIETLPEGCFSNLEGLQWVILRGCSKLRSLPSTRPLQYLEVLDLSHCTALQELEPFEFVHANLRTLDLSCTAFHSTPRVYAGLEFRHLYLRDAKVTKLSECSLTALRVLDLSGAQYVKDLGALWGGYILVALDLSRTGIESIDFISVMSDLRYLILRNCTRLVRLPEMAGLTNLEVLDISGCEILGDLPEDISNLGSLKELNLSGCSHLRELRKGLFDQMSCLEKLDLSKTNINTLPSFANLTKLRTLNLSSTSVEHVPDLSNLVNLKEFFSANCPKLNGASPGIGSGDIDLSSRMENLQPRCRLEGIFETNEIHLVSTFFSVSGFDQFKQNFDSLVDVISDIQENFKPTSPDTTSAPTTTPTAVDGSNSASCNISSRTFTSQLTRMVADVKYILHNIDLLESSRNCSSAEEMLDEIWRAFTHRSALDFLPDSTNLNELLRMIAKLKLLVPPKKVEAKQKSYYKEKEKFTFGMDIGEVGDGTDGGIDLNTPEMQDLSRSYEFLTDIQRICLLYFAAFPTNYDVKIKERILIQLWYGEGFIDPQHEENVAISNVISTRNPQLTTNQNQSLDPTAYSIPDPEIMGTSTETIAAGNVANPVSLKDSISRGVENPYTIEEIGREILKVLEAKGFVYIIVEDGSAFWIMDYSQCCFVRAKAKAEGLFDFNHKNGKLTPLFTGSQRVCLLKPQNNLPSSSKLWMMYAKSSEKLESFKTIRTLFNGDELIVDIRAEWFSEMRNLYVLHLGRWDYDKNKIFIHEPVIEAVDLEFLEELKNMKKLRLLSLEGFSTFKKLPDSVCKATNLRKLNLRGCSYLEELPAGIGSLKNLTHLDVTDCHILYKLPKGLRLLSKLEVLKGFMITYQVGGRQHSDACTLKALLKLEKLRKLNLVVNTEKFPDDNDVQVFKEMKNLCNLKITWEKDYSKEQASQDVVGQKASRQGSRWQQLRCWEQRRCQGDTEEPSKSNHFNKLKKLRLYCFPCKTVPNWLDPTDMQKLDNLYIVGGNLKTLHGDTNRKAWNVKIVRLKYLPNLNIDYSAFRCDFPHLMYLEKHKCGQLSGFPDDGIWQVSTEEIKPAVCGIKGERIIWSEK